MQYVVNHTSMHYMSTSVNTGAECTLSTIVAWDGERVKQVTIIIMTVSFTTKFELLFEFLHYLILQTDCLIIIPLCAVHSVIAN